VDNKRAEELGIRNEQLSLFWVNVCTPVFFVFLRKMIRMTTSNPLPEKALRFSIHAVQVCQKMIKQREYVLSKQLLKSATSIGANIEEAKYAQSKRDFLSKMNIALKEASETQYWIKVIRASGYGSDEVWNPLATEAHELTALLVAITKTLKRKLQLENDDHC